MLQQLQLLYVKIAPIPENSMHGNLCDREIVSLFPVNIIRQSIQKKFDWWDIFVVRRFSSNLTIISQMEN